MTLKKKKNNLALKRLSEMIHMIHIIHFSNVWLTEFELFYSAVTRFTYEKSRDPFKFSIIIHRDNSYVWRTVKRFYYSCALKLSKTVFFFFNNAYIGINSITHVRKKKLSHSSKFQQHVCVISIMNVLNSYVRVHVRITTKHGNITSDAIFSGFI